MAKPVNATYIHVSFAEIHTIGDKINWDTQTKTKFHVNVITNKAKYLLVVPVAPSF